MPESEPKPRLIELVDPGVGQGWKAVLKNGKAVVIHEIPVPAAEAAGAVPRIQRLFEHRHPALSPVLAWGTDPNGLWVAVEPNEGTPLGTMLSRGPLTPPAGAALGAALLSGVAALHETGIAMGGFGAAAVRVTSNGEVRLAGHPAGAVRGAPSQSDLRADVRSSGMAICAAFGVDPAGAPAPPNIPPGLVVTMRSMASGAMGPAADRAQGALREMAAALLAPDRMGAAQAELATRAGGREMPSITPFLPKTEAPAPAASTPEPPPFVPTVPRDDTPVPRAAASYDPPPRAPEPAPPGPPGPSAYAPYTPPPEAMQPEAPPAAPEPSPFSTTRAPIPVPAPPAPTSPFATNAPAPSTSAPPPAPAPPSDSPFRTAAPPPGQPGPGGTDVPAPPTWDTAAPVSAPQEAPRPAPPTYEPPPAAPAQYEPPAYSAATTAPPAPVSPQQTWTPVATPAWTPGVAPELTGAGETKAPTVPPSAEAPAPSGIRRPERDSRERPAWLVPAAIALVVLLLLGAIGVYLKTRPASSGGVAHASPSPKTSPKSSPKSSPTPGGAGLLPIPDYGPAVNSPLTSVKFCTPSAPCAFGGGAAPATDTNCKLGGSCHVDMAAYWSGNTVNTLTLSIEFFDRCNNPNNKSTAVFQHTYQNVSRFRPVYDPAPSGGFLLSLPSGVKAAALVAIANTGTVKAASAPFLLGADSCS